MIPFTAKYATKDYQQFHFRWFCNRKLPIGALWSGVDMKIGAKPLRTFFLCASASHYG
jgi:hypothetical protein